jgi:hypothetical protein
MEQNRVLIALCAFELKIKFGIILEPKYKIFRVRVKLQGEFIYIYICHALAQRLLINSTVQRKLKVDRTSCSIETLTFLF